MSSTLPVTTTHYTTVAGHPFYCICDHCDGYHHVWVES